MTEKVGREITYPSGAIIPLNSAYLPLIRGGSKRTTIRKGRLLAQVGTRMFFKTDQELLPFRLLSIRYLKFSELTDEHARLDGFASKKQLQDELRKYYADISDDDLVTVLEFRVESALTR